MMAINDKKEVEYDSYISLGIILPTQPESLTVINNLPIFCSGYFLNLFRTETLTP